MLTTTEPDLLSRDLCSWRTRAADRNDLLPLMRRISPFVDDLYPEGSKKLQETLELAFQNEASAHVAYCVHDKSRTPLALVCEKPKGKARIKVSTFWVDPVVRGGGLGRRLLMDRSLAWSRQEYDEIYGTVRLEGAAGIGGLFGKIGFKHVHTAPNRYGIGRDEAVFQSRAFWLPPRQVMITEQDGGLGELVRGAKGAQRDPLHA